MLIREFRHDEFINMEEAIGFLKDWIACTPKEILWLYGPKSCGKTTLIEYVIENELFEDFWVMKPRGDYWIRYVNLRRKLISSYDTFLDAFIASKEEAQKKEEAMSARISLGIFELKANILNAVRERKKDLFDVLIDELTNISKGKTPVLIIDEIQALEDVYINGERGLLKEFLNFCVSLTKELHLCHVVILSSNTIFINKIYNEARLKETSTFYKIGHFNKKTIFNYLKRKDKNIKNEELELIWEYLGGSILRIQRYLRDKDKISDLKEYLEKQVMLAESEIIDIMRRELDEKGQEMFISIAKEVIINGFYLIGREKDDLLNNVIDCMSEKEIVFFDPLTRKLTGTNRIYEKALERLAAH